MNMKPAIRYQLKDYRTAGLVLFLVNAALIGLALVGMFAISIEGEFSYTAYGFSAAIFMLVGGILSLRQVTRLCAQLGTGRKTAFLSLLPSGILAALGIAAAGELLMGGVQMLVGDRGDIYIQDLYYLIFMGFEPGVLTVGQHVMSALFSTCLMLTCFGFGLFASALFWRLNKIGCVIAGIAMGVCFIGGFPGLSYFFQEEMMAFGMFCLASPWNFMGVLLAFFVLFSLIAWFLVRNVNIRAGSK